MNTFTLTITSEDESVFKVGKSLEGNVDWPDDMTTNFRYESTDISEKVAEMLTQLIRQEVTHA